MDPIALLITVGAVLAAGGAAVGIGIAGRRRRRAAAATAVGSADATAELRAGQALVRIDDRLRTAQDELGFATAQFGEAAGVELSRALERARSRVTEAFRLRQALDDAIPDTAEQRREWTAQILSLCASAEQTLGERLGELDRLRADERRAPDEVARVRSRIGAVRERIPAAQLLLDRLAAQYSPEAVAGAAPNPEQAERLLQVVERGVDLAERRVAEGRGAEAPTALHAAADALERAGALLDAVERLEVEILRAESTLSALRAELDEDVDEARRLAAESRSAERRGELERAIEAAAAARAEAPEGAADSRDPLRALAVLRDADAVVDAAIAAERDHAARQSAARARLVTALDEAERQLTAAREIVAGYRGPIGPEARTRLAEAERLLDGITEERDPSAAVDRARRVAGLAAEASSLAQRDLEEARTRNSRRGGGFGGGGLGGSGGDIAGAVLGGLVVGGLLDGLGDIFDD